MCLILIALNAHPDYPLVVAANRDEYFARPTRPAGFWPEAPQLLAGQDLSAGGSWLGVTRQGRFAALTNVRDGRRPELTDAISRGHLVTGFLRGQATPGDYLAQLQGERYNGFNLLCGDGGQLLYHSNRQPGITPLPAGVHGVSNGTLNTPWPKLVSGKQALADYLAHQHTLHADDLLAILNHRQPAPEALLPDTGVDPHWERLLSSRFIEAPAYGYGTRCSTLLLQHLDGRTEFIEWDWDDQGRLSGRRDYCFTRQPEGLA